MKLIKFTCALLLTACISVSHASVIHVTDGSGNLLGARNVLVNGTLYDVDFSDGTCASLFTGCDDSGDFIFATEMDAILASNALLEQVFLDIDIGNFDSSPNLTRGISNAYLGEVSTPWGFVSYADGYVRTSMAINFTNSIYDTDRSDTEIRTVTGTTVRVRDKAWAVWAKATAVPEPSTVILLFLGLAGLSFARYRRQS